MIGLGLMSGTSLDGVDAALVRIEPRGDSYILDLLQFATVPFDEDLAQALRNVLPPNGATVAQAAGLHRRLGTAFARAARNLAGALRVDYIASHGQTIWHDGPAHVSVQIGDPFIIRETMNATVCYDFRSADCAVGGHGAPLVPYIDALLFANDAEDRVALNIGGIANITALPAASAIHDVMAFDTGPGNMLIDAFVRERTGGECDMDEDGAFAARGTVEDRALSAMLADAYFALSPPKTTGRERFGGQFLQEHGAWLDPLSIEDGAATIAELSAVSIAEAIVRAAPAAARVLVSGGGARNAHLMRRLQARLPTMCVESTDAYGIPADAKEAIAFAMLGYETLRERAANVPRVTGASRAVPLGAIAPARLRELIAGVERECQSS
ncbi:MAG TPA: anhydro-N-acetylmuramic acid kinase [Candidatus Baltobacteraceae bacterium]|jgi:anhydro-N-acetylmuramic acid kinase|nr:anhydro-N-acetylmuramic acid kinase [Candidatus Baltobacteraceae bacterium]